MVPWFKSVLSKINFSKNDSSHKQFHHAEDFESVAIDSAALRCPVCLNVYQSVPLNLTCGHTFCIFCLENIAKRERCQVPSSPRTDKTFQCPICRERCSLQTAVKNFLVSDLLDNVGVIADSDEAKTLLFGTNTRVTMERLKTKNNEMEATVNRLRIQIEESKRREKFNYIAIVFFILTYITINSLII